MIKKLAIEMKKMIYFIFKIWSSKIKYIYVGLSDKLISLKKTENSESTIVCVRCADFYIATNYVSKAYF